MKKGSKHTKEALFKMTQSHLGQNKGKKRPPFSKEWRDNMSKGRMGVKISRECSLAKSIRQLGKKHKPHVRGELHGNYKKDRTLLKKDPRKDLDTKYKYWMLEVKKRDGWNCRFQSSDCKGRLEAHHIFNWIDYVELRYIVNNGITLCHFHHPRGREEEKRMIPIFQELLLVSKE